MSKSEYQKCKFSIAGLVVGFLAVLVAIVLIALYASERTKCIKEQNCQTTENKISHKLYAAIALFIFAFLIVLFATINAIYRGCYKTMFVGFLLI